MLADALFLLRLTYFSPVMTEKCLRLVLLLHVLTQLILKGCRMTRVILCHCWGDLFGLCRCRFQ